MKIDSIFKQIRDILQSAGGVKFSFGNPVSVGNISIIPVARVSFGFGAGSGKLPGSKKKKKGEILEDKIETDDNIDFKGGGGGGIKTEPIGIYAIKGDRVKYYPVITIREMVGIFGFALLLLFRISKLRRKKK